MKIFLCVAINLFLLHVAWAEEHGFVIYREPGNTYVESIRFAAVRNGTVYSTLIRPDGSKRQVYNEGILASVGYPDPGTVDAGAAAQKVAECQAMLNQYPQFKTGIQAALMQWQNALAFAKQRPAVQPPPAPVVSSAVASGEGGNAPAANPAARWKSASPAEVRELNWIILSEALSDPYYYGSMRSDRLCYAAQMRLADIRDHGGMEQIPVAKAALDLLGKEAEAAMERDQSGLSRAGNNARMLTMFATGLEFEVGDALERRQRYLQQHAHSEHGLSGRLLPSHAGGHEGGYRGAGKDAGATLQARSPLEELRQARDG